uniref:SGNH hydrolase-type esterase domain-containing protein n=1 Tax=Coccolithus braarudii TaxID=221442 RepID=A0A7S0PYL5_9EUKA
MPARLSREIDAAASPYDGIVVIGGSNDLWKGDESAIWDSLCELYKRVQASSSSAILGMVTLPPFEPAVFDWLSFTGIGQLTETTRLAVNERVREEAGRCPNAFLVDLDALCGTEESCMERPDGLHFTSRGYHRLGEEVASTLQAAHSTRAPDTDLRS